MKRKLAVFDFDGTVYPGRSLVFLCRQYRSFAGSRLRYYGVMSHFLTLYALYKLGILAGERSKERALVKFIHLFRGESEAAIKRFFAEAYRNMRARLCPEVLAEARRLKEQGYTLVLVSGACKPLLDNLAREAGFDLVIGTNVPLRNGRFDAAGGIEYVNGAAKVPALLAACGGGGGLDLEESYAFADSYSDLPLLELVGRPVAVRPDARLRQVARARNWRIMGV